MRIASLIPSGTDIACALGLRDHLVGISHCCDAPGTSHLPILTRSIVDAAAPPSQIDAAVNEAVAAGQSLYLTDRELLRELAPDIVLTQTICDVCAVNANQAARDLPPGAQLINLSATSLAGLWTDIEAVASAASIPANALISHLQYRLQAVQHAIQNLPVRTAIVLEWTDPPFLGGHWVPEMVQMAGGTHLLAEPGLASRRATWQEIQSANPEFLLVSPCGYDLEQSLQQSAGLDRRGHLTGLTSQVWAANATALFSRCTPATIRGIEVLAGLFHPTAFAPGEPTEIQSFRQ